MASSSSQGSEPFGDCPFVAILDRRVHGGKLEYLVYRGNSSEFSQCWQEKQNIECPEMIVRYEEERQNTIRKIMQTETESADAVVDTADKAKTSADDQSSESNPDEECNDSLNKQSKKKKGNKNEDEKESQAIIVPIEDEGPPNKRAKLSEEEETIKAMSYDKKLQLALDIAQLTGDKLVELYRIVESCEPSSIAEDENDFEIDFEGLQPSTIRKMESFLRRDIDETGDVDVEGCDPLPSSVSSEDTGDAAH